MAKTPASIQNLPLFISQILLLAVLYFAAGQASFSLSVSHSIITLVVFAAEGFALSFVILWGKRLWLGVFLGQLVLALYNGLAWQLAFGVSIINSLEAVIGAILFHRMAIQAPFAKMRDTLGLLILIFFVLQPFSATLGTLLLWLGDVVPGTQLISSWFSWWFGNSLGQALITPLLLSFFADKNSVKQKLHRVFWLILLVIPISILMLSTQYFPSSIIIVFTVTLLLLVSIAARGGSAMVSLAIVIITVIALSITKRMMGVFIHDGVILLLDLNIYLLGIILIGQLLASLLTEYKQTRLAQQKIAEHLQKISDHFPGMIYTFRMNPDGSYCMPYTSVGIQAIYHLSPEEVQNSAAKVFALIHPEDYDTVVASIEVSAQHLTPWQCDYRIRFENGTVRWLSGHSVPQREENGAILWHGFMKDVTESKQKEIEYQAVIEASFSGFWCVDFSGRFLSVNTALCHILGYSRQELLAMCIGDIEAIETPEDIAARANNIIQTGHDSFESQHRRKDGELIDVAVNVLYVASLGQRFFTFVNDITDSKQAEKKLQENQQKLNVIFDTLGVGISITDEHGNIIDCNKSSESLLGVAKQDHLQRNYAGKEWQIIRADFTPMPAEEFASVRALKDNIPVSNVEMGIVKQHGEITWLLVSATPVGIKGYGVVIAYMDITARKHSQNALIASEEKYRTLFNSIQDGIVFVDMQGNILDCNQYYCDMLGLGKQEVTQIHFNQITPDEWHDLEADILRQQVMTRGYSDLYEKEYIKKDGTVFPIELRAWLINDKQDNAVGMWAIVRDITERKHIEKTHTFLSQTVRQYTDESFFESLARYLAQCLDMEFVCIDRLEGDGLTAETVAVYHNGSFEDNVSYALKDTPCGDVVGQTVCCFPASVCQFFPKDEVLKTLNAESYIGVTLWGSTGEAIGLIAVIGEKPINNRLLAESILKIVAVRAAGELERNRMEAELRNSHNELLRYFDQPFIGMLTAGHDKKILHVNQRFCDMVGYSKEEMQLIDWGEITHPDDIAPNQAYLEQMIRGCCDAYQMETRYIHKDGHIVYVDLAVYCVRKADGQPDYFIRMMLDITQRKSVERYLQKNQALLQTAQRAARLGHYVTDLKTKTWTNDLLFDEIFGIDRSFNRDFVNWRQLIFPEDRRRVKNYFAQTIRDHEIFPTIEYRMIRPCDGLMRWVAVWGHNFYDDNGNPVQQVGMIQDINERKLNEQQLQKTTEQLQLVLEGGHLGFWDWNIPTDEVQRNVIWAEMLGYRYEEIENTTKQWEDFIHPDDRKKALQSIRYVLNGRIPYHEIEYRMQHKDGSFVWVLDHASIVQRDAGGKPTRMSGTHTDITKLKRLEEQLRESENFFSSLAQVNPVGIYRTDAQGNCIYVNQRWCEITGISSQEAQGSGWQAVIMANDREKVYNEWAAALHEQRQFALEYRFQQPNGKITWVYGLATVIHDEAGHTLGYVGTTTDITERKATEEYINNLAFYDPLTQLPNRRLLQERLKHGIEIDHRTGSQIAVLMMDLDKFKAVNDSLGHAAGDELLKQVAERIKSRLREVDTIARLGGDEFVILMEDVTHDEYIARVANDVIHTLSQPFMLYQHHEVHIGISIGIAIHPQHGDSVEELMDNADTALYHAKDQGRGCFAYFSETLTQKARERIALEASLRHAIEQQELRVYFQPQVEINSGRLIGAEALVRWYDPVHGCLMPDDFISLAEETGLIVVIGEWVLRETCRLGRQWLDQGLPPLTLSVNISPYQFRRYDINALLTDVLRDTGFPADSLELEVTETGLMENKEHALSILNRLHEQGVHIAIDNFGTGYSSLAALKYFPLDVLRIDKTFIDDVPFLEGDIAITATIISMAHNLGFKVLADGVETSEQLAFLRTHHCDHYQGHLYSKALSADEFVQFLKST